MSNHKDLAGFASNLSQFLCVRNIQGERFFDKYILSHFQGSFGQAVVLFGWGGNHNSFNVLPLKHIFIRSRNIHAFVLLL